MRSIFKIAASGLGAVALAGLLASCEKKAEDATTTPAAVAPSTAPAPTDAAVATGGAEDANRREHEGAMSDDMAERHRQDMDHDSMRRGPMGPMGPGATPAPTESPAAQPPMGHM